MEEMINFKKKFMLDRLVIFETEFWIWSLRPQQVTLGSSVLSLKRPAETFIELSDAELIDLRVIATVMEKTLRSIFSYSKINYLMLMMQDNFVHYHIVPRYSEAVYFAESGITFNDALFPGPPDLSIYHSLDHRTLEKIASILANAAKGVGDEKV